MQLSVASGQWSVLNEMQGDSSRPQAPAWGRTWTPSSSLAKGTLPAGLAEFKQSRALNQNGFPSRSLGTRRKLL